jgi:hypothetical protein
MWVSFNLFSKHASSTKYMFLSSHQFLAAARFKGAVEKGALGLKTHTK